MLPNERTPQRSWRACQLPPHGHRWHLGAMVQTALAFIPPGSSLHLLSARQHPTQNLAPSMRLWPASPCPRWQGLGPGSPPHTSCSPAHLSAWDVPPESRSSSAEPPEIDKGGNQLFCPPSPGCQGQQDPKTSNINHLPISMF